MRIGMLVYNDFLEDLRVHKEARDLAAAGHDVLVVARRSRESIPAEESIAGYRVRRIEISGPLRTRVRAISDRAVARPESFRGRLVESIRRNRWRRIYVAERYRRRWGRGALSAIADHSPQVVHAHDLDTLDLGLRAASAAGARLVYDSHELWRANNFLAKMPRFVQRRWRRMESELIGRADAVVTTTVSRAEQLSRWYPGIEPRVVMNCQDGEVTAATTALRDRLGLGPERRILLYQGLLHADRGVFVALEALQRLDGRFVFVAIGSGGDEGAFVRAIGRPPHAGRAFHIPAVPHAELASLTASADYGLSLIQNTSLSYYLSAPNKLFEYMRAGLPVIASAFPEVDRLFAHGDLGERVDPADSDAVAAAIERLESDPDRRRAIGSHAQEMVRTTFAWERQAETLRELYRSLGAREGRSR